MLHIRMNGTTAILSKNYPYAKYHQGIFIDIFPLDGIIENKIFLKFQTFSKKLLNLIMWYKNNRECIKPSLKSIILFLSTLLPQKMLFSMFESVCSWKKTKSAKYLDLVSYFGFAGKRLCSSYENIEQVEFEDTKIPIPQGYDDVLTSLYGTDYMTPRQDASDHGEVFFDTKHSYKDYLNGKLKIPEEYINKWQNQ